MGEFGQGSGAGLGLGSGFWVSSFTPQRRFWGQISRIWLTGRWVFISRGGCGGEITRGREGTEGTGGICPLPPSPRAPPQDETRSEGQRMVREFQESQREFRELQRFLEEKQRLLLARLGDLERDISRARDQARAKVSEELSQLETLIWEMEGKFQQPPSQFLQVRARRAGTGRGKGGKKPKSNTREPELSWFRIF